MLSKMMRAYSEGGTDEVLWRAKRKLGLVRRLQTKYHLGRTINSVYGVRLACNFEDATFKMYVRGGYGRFYWDHLSSISNPFIFVDIGANQGLYSLCAAKNNFNIASYSFEPNKDIFDLLERNIKINQLEGKCMAHNIAISDSSGTAELVFSKGHSGGATLVDDRRGFGDTSMDIETINHKEFDELLSDGDAAIFVKVDVEGFEKAVLSELVKSRHVGRIAEVFYEVDENWVNPGELRDILELAGFKHFETMGSGEHYDVLASR